MFFSRNGSSHRSFFRAFSVMALALACATSQADAQQQATQQQANVAPTPSNLSMEPDSELLFVPYENSQLSEQLQGTSTLQNGSEISVPLNHRGWYSVVLGIWNPDPSTNKKPTVRARLASNKADRWVSASPSKGEQQPRHSQEVHFCSADLTHESAIMVGRNSGIQSRDAYIAYVKLIPLSDTQVQEILVQQKKSHSAQKLISSVLTPSSGHHVNQ